MIRMCEGIREYCKRQGFKGSAEVADEIDKVLCHLYRGGSTSEWEEVIVTSRFGIWEDGSTSVYNELMSSFRLTCGRCSECFGCELNRLIGDYLIGMFKDVYSKEFEKYMMS